MDEKAHEKTCTRCNKTKNITEFYNDNKSICKICSDKDRDKHLNTFRGYLLKLVNSARSSSIKRTEDGRPEAGTFAITIDDVIDIWTAQNGLCYYSKLPMKTQRLTDWQASIDRQNQDLGYVKDNIVLCALELNSVQQWSLEKINELKNILSIEHIYQDVSFDLLRRKHTQNKINPIIIDDVEHHKCNKCNIVKPRLQFNGNISAGCKECIKQRDEERKSSPREAMLIILKGARCSTIIDKINLINNIIFTIFL